MNIGDGRNTNIWSDPWLSHAVNFLVLRLSNCPAEPIMVADLINHHTLD